MVPSVSPIEFFETQRYAPKSSELTDLMRNFIWTLYALSTNSGSYLAPVKICNIKELLKLFNNSKKKYVKVITNTQKNICK